MTVLVIATALVTWGVVVGVWGIGDSLDFAYRWGRETDRRSNAVWTLLPFAGVLIALAADYVLVREMLSDSPDPNVVWDLLLLAIAGLFVFIVVASVVGTIVNLVRASRERRTIDGAAEELGS